MIGYPRRNDLVAAWLKRKRDEYEPNSIGWVAVDNLLDDYRLRSDTGRSLMGEAVGG